MAKPAASETSKKPAKAAPQQVPASPLSDADLARVVGGYIGETEKHLPPR